MKTGGLTVPLMLTGLIFVAVWAVGMLAVQSSALATESSLELLRLHLEVARMHEALLERSGEATAKQVERIEQRLERWPESWTVGREAEPGGAGRGEDSKWKGVTSEDLSILGETP